MKNNSRLSWLDYLRGFCALSIMLYHYSMWSFGDFPSETFLGKIGIYGVSIFYILSGLTLFHVYRNKLEPNFLSIRNFFIKRFFRIYPLLWVITILTLILDRTIPNTGILVLNLTGLFGFLKWDAYIATGAWSIGNELVFYVLFPFLLFFSQKKKLIFIIIVIIFLCIYAYYAFIVLDVHKTLALQWTNYVNPLNQAFLFVVGVFIGFLFKTTKIKNRYLLGILFITMLLFIFYPVAGDMIYITAQWNRLIITMFCCCVCVCFYKFSINLPHFIHYPMSKLGEATYSVYLMHPIVWSGVKIFLGHFIELSTLIQFIISILCTIIGSLLIYHFIEKRFINIGNKIIKNDFSKLKCLLFQNIP